MAAFVQCTLLLGLSLYIWGARSSWFLLGLACVFAALPVTGSRSVIVISIFGSASLLFAAFMRKLIGFKALFSFMFMFAALAAISYFTQNSVWEALSQRAATAGDEDRVFTAFMSAFDFFDVAGFTGYGTGSANLGAVALIGSIAPFSWLPIGGGFEEEAGRIVLELGIIGWLLSLCLRIALFCWAIVLAVDGTTRNVRLVGVIALPVLALGVYQGTAVFGVPIWAVYNWCCVGFMGMAQHQQLQIRAARTAAQRDMALNRIRC